MIDAGGSSDKFNPMKAPQPSELNPVRFCTGGCKPGEHHNSHLYSVDPIDGPMGDTFLCPGNDKVFYWIEEDGTNSNYGYTEEILKNK